MRTALEGHSWPRLCVAFAVALGVGAPHPAWAEPPRRECPDVRSLAAEARAAFDADAYLQAAEVYLRMYHVIRDHVRSTPESSLDCTAEISLALLQALDMLRSVPEPPEKLWCDIRIGSKALLASGSDSVAEHVEVRAALDEFEARGLHANKCREPGEADALKHLPAPVPAKPSADPESTETLPTPDPVQSVDRRQPARPQRPLLIAGWTLVGTSIVGLGLLTAPLLVIRDAEHDLDWLCRVSCATDDADVAAARTQARQAQIGAVVLGSMAGVALVAGASLLGVAKRRSSASAFVPAVGPGYAGMSFSARF